MARSVAGEQESTMSKLAPLGYYEKACRAVAEALSVDELKKIRIEAEAIRAAAKVAKNRTMEADATAIRMRAVRRLDQLIEAQKATVGLAKGGKPYQRKPTGVADTPVATLAMQGIDKNLAKQARVLGALSAEKFEAVVADARDRVTHAVRDVVRHVEILQKRASYSLDVPSALLPLPGADRKLLVLRKPSQRRWMLVVGPNISAARLKEKEQTARETMAVRHLQQEHDSFLARAEALEAEAKALRRQAEDIKAQIRDEIKAAVGKVAPFAETFEFECDEATDAELAAQPRPNECELELVNRLLAARGSSGNGLKEVDRGYWGNMDYLGYQPPIPGPGSWTGCGSPDWLAEFFPDLHEAPREQPAASQSGAAMSERDKPRAGN
jgi:hypothetical protein